MSKTTSSILLKGGTALIHDESNHVVPTQVDVLIEGDIISRIEANIQVSSTTQIIDCYDKLISPGFIDTHHHLWQTLLKGRHANHLLMAYFPDGKFPFSQFSKIKLMDEQGNFTSSLHTPADFYWGQLGGALECLDAGTTTVVDHAHLNYSPEHSSSLVYLLITVYL